MSLGIEDGRIPASALTASTVYSAGHATTRARLNLAAASGKAGSWCAKTNNVNQWLQIDLRTATTGYQSSNTRKTRTFTMDNQLLAVLEPRGFFLGSVHSEG